MTTYTCKCCGRKDNPSSAWWHNRDVYGKDTHICGGCYKRIARFFVAASG